MTPRRKSRRNPRSPQRARRWTWRKIPANRSYLEAHEEAVILCDMVALGGGELRWLTCADLYRAYPMRYSKAYLPRTLKRMARSQRVTRRQGIRWAYRVTEREAEAIAFASRAAA